jgi:hypothetical protein
MDKGDDSMKPIAYAHLCFVFDVNGVKANTSCFVIVTGYTGGKIR